MIPPTCRCTGSSHAATCVVQEIRRTLFAGLYDDDDDRRPLGVSARVRLLDPAYHGDDPTSRRFALLETE